MPIIVNLDQLKYYSKFIRTRLGHFYLCIPKKLVKYNGPLQNTVIAFDPGIKAFYVEYDVDGIIMEVRKSDTAKIYGICYSCDELQSEWPQPKTQQEQEFNFEFEKTG